MIVLTTANQFSPKDYWIFVFACNCGSYRFRTAHSCQLKTIIASIDVLLNLFTEFRLELKVLKTFS